jgi:hypothetical protein
MGLLDFEKIAGKAVAELIQVLRNNASQLSRWSYDGPSSSSLSVSVDPLAGQGPGVGVQAGNIRLLRDKEEIDLFYALKGISLGIAIPLQFVTISFSMTDLPSGGFLGCRAGMPDFERREDFYGPCCAISIDGACAAQATFSALLLGIDPELIKILKNYITHLNSLMQLKTDTADSESFGAALRRAVTMPIFGFQRDYSEGLLAQSFWAAEKVVQLQIDIGTLFVRLVTAQLFRGILFSGTGSMSFAALTAANISVNVALHRGWISGTMAEAAAATAFL